MKFRKKDSAIFTIIEIFKTKSSSSKRPQIYFICKRNCGHPPSLSILPLFIYDNFTSLKWGWSSPCVEVLLPLWGRGRFIEVGEHCIEKRDGWSHMCSLWGESRLVEIGEHHSKKRDGWPHHYLSKFEAFILKQLYYTCSVSTSHTLPI